VAGPHHAPLSRARQAALSAGLVLVVAGGLLAWFAPPPPVPVPVAPEVIDTMPRLTYVRSIPEAGEAPFSRPVGVAVGGGLLYVADAEDGVVRVFSMTGRTLGEMGRDVLDVPAYVAFDGGGSALLVTDRGARAVFVFEKTGEFVGALTPSSETTSSVETTPSWEPLGVAADGFGAIAVTDTSGRHHVWVMDRAGEPLLSLGGLESLETSGGVTVALDYPNSVAFLGTEIWVSDSNNRRLLVFDRDGSFLRFVRVDGVTRGLAFVEGSLEGARYVAVADVLGSQVLLLDDDGTTVASYGGPGTEAGRLAYPNDVAYDRATDQLFVADTGNRRVQVWSVQWPEPGEPPAAPEQQAAISAMQLAGLIVVVLGLVVGIAAAWPRRRERDLPEDE
jgi:DNA-binding beta-propeller fold protein YncE